MTKAWVRLPPDIGHRRPAEALGQGDVIGGDRFGSDAGYREWAYTAFTRARGQTRFYICEPEPSRGFSHKALRSLRAGILLPCYL